MAEGEEDRRICTMEVVGDRCDNEAVLLLPIMDRDDFDETMEIDMGEEMMEGALSGLGW